MKPRWIVSLGLLLAIPGCGSDDSADSSSVVDLPNAQDIVEVDLGPFDLTIAQSSTNSSILLDLQAFAKIPRYKAPELQQALQENQNQFRHSVILKIRQLDRPTLNDPGLNELRRSIKESVKEVAPEIKIDGIGFYQFRFLEE